MNEDGIASEGSGHIGAFAVTTNRSQAAKSSVSESAGHVGDDFWSIEYKVEFGHLSKIPTPEKGDRWGVSAQRVYRQAEWSVWTVADENMNYGWFLFQ